MNTKKINEIMSNIEQEHFEHSEGIKSPIDYLLYLGSIGQNLKQIEKDFTIEDYKEIVDTLNEFNSFFYPLEDNELDRKYTTKNIKQ
jgi:hypothetical protein